MDRKLTDNFNFTPKPHLLSDLSDLIIILNLLINMISSFRALLNDLIESLPFVVKYSVVKARKQENITKGKKVKRKLLHGDSFGYTKSDLNGSSG